MKNNNSSGKRLILLLVCFAMLLFFARDIPAQILFEAGPWWVYFLIAGIFISGYYWLKFTLEDRKIDEEWIEKEGEVFMKRIEQLKAEKENG